MIGNISNGSAPIGVFYRDEQPTYEDCEPALRNGPLVGQPLGLSKETSDELMGGFMRGDLPDSNISWHYPSQRRPREPVETA